MGTTASTISSAQVISQIAVAETVTGAPGASGEYVSSTALNPGATQYTSSSTPAGIYYSAQTVTLDAYGAATIDLTDLPGTQADIDGTGYEVQFFRIRSASSSNGALTISPGASNPYPMFGSGNDMEYPAACTKAFQMEFGAGLGTIADASGTNAYQIDLAGTASNQFYVEFIIG